MDPNVNKEKKQLNSKVKEFVPVSKETNSKKQHPAESSMQTLIDLLLSMNLNYQYKHDFARLKDYTDLEHVKQRFIAMRSINDDNCDIEQYKDAAFFIVRSSHYDDIHKAMKYGIWSSTAENNARISETFAKYNKEGKKVVLLFRVASENILCGAAELISNYIEEQQFDYWWNKARWKGIFNLKWIYVKNIDLKSITRKEGEKRFYELYDGEQLSAENGHFILDMFNHIEFKYDYSIFKFFMLFDQREDYLMGVRSTMDVQIKLQKQDRKQSHPIETFRAGPKKQSNAHAYNYQHDEDKGGEYYSNSKPFNNKRSSHPVNKYEPGYHSKGHKNRRHRKSSYGDMKGGKEQYIYVQKSSIDKQEDQKVADKQD